MGDDAGSLLEGRSEPSNFPEFVSSSTSDDEDAALGGPEGRFLLLPLPMLGLREGQESGGGARGGRFLGSGERPEV